MHAAVLKYIVEVARQGSIRKAGAVLNVASTGINRQILKLEEELGVRIFDRTPDGVQLTEAGKLILKHAVQTLQGFEQLRPQISDVRGMRSGHINIATINSLSFRILPEIITSFSAAHPGVTLTVRQAPADDVIQIVEDGYADIGMTFSYFDRQSVRPAIMIASPFGAIVSPDHPLANERTVTLAQCVQYRMIKHYDPEGQHIFLDEILQKESLEVSTYMFTNSMVLAKQMVEQGLGLGVYIKHGLHNELEQGRLKFIPIDHPGLAGHKLGIFIPSNRFIHPIDRVFVKVACDICAKYDSDSAHHLPKLDE